MTAEQRDRLAGIASRMRTRATVQAGSEVSSLSSYRSLTGYAAEIEACIAEPAEAQPACRVTVTTIVLRECRMCGTLTTNEVTRLCEACSAAQAMAERLKARSDADRDGGAK